jgi:hypothetical protein
MQVYIVVSELKTVAKLPGVFSCKFVEVEERSERNEHVKSVNESERISAGGTYLSEKEARSLAGQ